MPGSGTDPRAARVDPFVDENNHINNIIYVCYCLFWTNKQNKPYFVLLLYITIVVIVITIINSILLIINIIICLIYIYIHDIKHKIL